MERPLNHHYREPGTKLDSGLLTREQEAHAATQINRGLEAAQVAGSSINASTARLIAAALHSGIGSYLEQFAATGALNPGGALNEIRGEGKVELHHIPWIRALQDFLEQIHCPNPDLAEVEHTEPAPLIYVQANDPTAGLQGGRWLNATAPASELDEQMQAIANETGGPGTSPLVTAAVGFHELPLAPDTSASDLAQYAQGIRLYGEAYALLAEHLGHPIDGDEFRLLHENTCDSMTELIARSPEVALNYVRQTSPSTFPPRAAAFNSYERVLRQYYLCLEGREGVHVFHRQLVLAPEAE